MKNNKSVCKMKIPPSTRDKFGILLTKTGIAGVLLNVFDRVLNDGNLHQQIAKIFSDNPSGNTCINICLIISLMSTIVGIYEGIASSNHDINQALS